MRQLFLLIVLIPVFLMGQEDPVWDNLDVGYFHGSILRHNKDIAHLIRAHPRGVVLGYNRKTFGEKRWHRAYNYPDWGVSAVIQDGVYEPLGTNLGLYGHLNFYFFKRSLMLRLAQGIAYATNPFDLEDNFKNNAYGSHLLSSTYLQLNFKKENIFKRFGLQAGIQLLHYSNANFRAPNSSTNAFNIHAGLNYNLNAEVEPAYTVIEEEDKVTDKIHLNLVLRGGVNESDYLNLGQHPFAVFSAYLDKRLGYVSSLHLGVDAFFARFLEKEIEYLAASGLDRELEGDEDYRRIGLQLGHELHMGRLSFVTQLGYYVYYPYDFEGRTYIRAGFKYFVNSKIFPVVSLKSHGAKIEALEFGIGWRI